MMKGDEIRQPLYSPLLRIDMVFRLIVGWSRTPSDDARRTRERESEGRYVPVSHTLVG